jgi:phage recombination protein Bet
MSNDIAILEEKDLQIADKLGIEIELYRALRYSLFPDKKIPDYAFGLYLAYCKAKGYDPMRKPFHIVMFNRNTAAKGKEPVWENYPVVMPGIVSYRIDANRTGTFYGISDSQFGPVITENLGSLKFTYPEWCRIVIYKKIGDKIVEIPATLYFKECYATKDKNSEQPNEMWQKRPRYMLEKCTEAACYRKGFPEETGSIPTYDEMEGRDTMEDLPGEKDITEESKQASKPLSLSYTVDEDTLNKHLDLIKNSRDKDTLQIAYNDAMTFSKGDKMARNEIVRIKNERKLYIEQLQPKPVEQKTETIPAQDEWLDAYNGKESK